MSPVAGYRDRLVKVTVGRGERGGPCASSIKSVRWYFKLEGRALANVLESSLPLAQVTASGQTDGKALRSVHWKGSISPPSLCCGYFDRRSVGQ